MAQDIYAEHFLSGEATTLNTSWMEQSPRQEEYLCRDPNAVVLKLTRNNTLATKALAQTLIPSTFSLVSNHLEIHRGSNFHLKCSQNSLKKVVVALKVAFMSGAWLEQHSRARETNGVISGDVSVKELEGLFM